MSAAAEEVRRLRFGTAEPEPESRRLAAGPLTAELANGNLRAIRYRGREVLRAIGYLVRDEDWGTYAPEISGLAVEETGTRFRVGYEARCRARDGNRLAVTVSIEGDAAGRLSFDATAVPERDFSTNRCGFNILHPITGVAGTPVTVEHVDGRIERSAFPEAIDPAQPFRDMRAITHTLAPGVTARVLMEGDAFEMEDQRNWTDASFKTYVRPLALPWPYVLPAGVPNRQTITLTIAGGEALPEAAGAGGPVEIALGGDLGRVPAIGPLPAIGLVVTPEETAATLEAVALLGEIAPQELLLSFDPTAGHGLAALEGFAALARAVPARTTLECVVPCRRDLAAELGEVAALAARAGLRLDAVSVSPAVDRKSTPPGSRWPDCPPLEAVYAAARAAFPGVRLGGGMFSNFTELNRKRPPLGRLDYVTHAATPIVHAADDRSVMETLEALPFVARSTRGFVGETPYRIGPATIGMRMNPYGSRTADNPDGRRVPMARLDPRQRGLFAAAWTIGTAAALTEAGLEALTFGGLTGPFGCVEAGRRLPVFHALRALAAIGGRPARAAASSDPARGLALAAEGREGPVVLLANLTDALQPVRLAGLAGPVSAAILDERSASVWAEDPAPASAPLAAPALDLLPYAVAILVGGSPS